MDRTKQTIWVSVSGFFMVRTDGNEFRVSTGNGEIGTSHLPESTRGSWLVDTKNMVVTMFHNAAAVNTCDLQVTIVSGEITHMWANGNELFAEKLPEQDVPADADVPAMVNDEVWGDLALPEWATAKLDEYASLTGVTGGEFAIRLIIDGLRRLDREILRTIEANVYDPSDDLFT